MTNTREKLVEAEYFLGQMRARRHEPQTFRHNLSAYLAAARSVTLIMQAEFAHISGFNDWYAERRDEFSLNHQFRLFNEKRNETVHKRGLRPLGRVRAYLAGSGTYQGGLMTPRTSAEISERMRSELNVPGMTVVGAPEWLWYFDFQSLSQPDIISLSVAHLDQLESLTRECESRFDASA